MQFSTGNRAIERFNTQTRAFDSANAAEDAAFERRRQIEQQRGVDTALREGIGGFYANQPAAPATPAVATPGAVPPAPPVSVSPAVPNFPSVDPADALVVPNMEAGPEMTQPAAQPAQPVAQPVAQLVSQPAAQPSPGAELIRRISATPGTGATVMQLHNQEQQRGQQNARLRQTAEIQAIRALHSGQPDIAAAIARQYGINIPEEVIKDHRFQAEMKSLGSLIKQNGINDDAMAASITRSYLEGRKNELDQQAALTEAFNKAPTARQPKRSWSDSRGAWVEEPTEQNPQGRAIVPPGTPARQVSSGGRGGGGSGGLTATERNMAARLKLLTDGGMPLAEAQRIVGGASGKQPSARDAASIATRLMSTTDDLGRPIYKNFQEALRAAKEALGMTGANAGGGAAPAAKPPLASFGQRPPLSQFEKK